MANFNVFISTKGKRPIRLGVVSATSKTPKLVLLRKVALLVKRRKLRFGPKQRLKFSFSPVVQKRIIRRKRKR